MGTLKAIFMLMPRSAEERHEKTFRIFTIFTPGFS
jgi:hypothetical protein